MSPKTASVAGGVGGGAGGAGNGGGDAASVVVARGCGCGSAGGGQAQPELGAKLARAWKEEGDKEREGKMEMWVTVVVLCFGF